MDRGMGNPWGSWVGVPRGMGMGKGIKGKTLRGTIPLVEGTYPWGVRVWV